MKKVALNEEEIYLKAKNHFEQIINNSKPEDIIEAKNGCGLSACRFALFYVKPPDKNQGLYNRIYNLYFDYIKNYKS